MVDRQSETDRHTDRGKYTEREREREGIIVFKDRQTESQN